MQKTGSGTGGKHVDFVDIGPDDGLRLKELALSHPGKTFIGIERPQIAKKAKSDSVNLQFRFGGAEEELRNIPDESVKVVNADFLFGDVYLVSGGNDVAERVLREAGIGGNAANPLYATRQRIVGEIRRVLSPGGRLYLTEYRHNLPLTLKLLDEAGFAYETRDFAVGEMDRTKQLRELKEHLAKHPEDCEERWPTRISARKAGKIHGDGA